MREAICVFAHVAGHMYAKSTVVFHASGWASAYSSYQQNRRKTHEGTPSVKKDVRQVQRSSVATVGLRELREPAPSIRARKGISWPVLTASTCHAISVLRSDSPIFTALVRLVRPRFATRLVSIIILVKDLTGKSQDS